MRMEFIREIRAEFHFAVSVARATDAAGQRNGGRGRLTIEKRRRERGKKERVRTAGGEAWKKGDHTRRDKEEKRGEAKGVDNTHISIRYPYPPPPPESLLSPSIPFCPRTLSNHSEREQPTEQAVPRLLNVIKSSLPPSLPPPNRLDSSPPPPFSSARFRFLEKTRSRVARSTRSPFHR